MKLTSLFFVGLLSVSGLSWVTAKRHNHRTSEPRMPEEDSDGQDTSAPDSLVFSSTSEEPSDGDQLSQTQHTQKTETVPVMSGESQPETQPQTTSSESAPNSVAQLQHSLMGDMILSESTLAPNVTDLVNDNSTDSLNNTAIFNATALGGMNETQSAAVSEILETLNNMSAINLTALNTTSLNMTDLNDLLNNTLGMNISDIIAQIGENATTVNQTLAESDFNATIGSSVNSTTENQDWNITDTNTTTTTTSPNVVNSTISETRTEPAITEDFFNTTHATTDNPLDYYSTTEEIDRFETVSNEEYPTTESSDVTTYIYDEESNTTDVYTKTDGTDSVNWDNPAFGGLVAACVFGFTFVLILMVIIGKKLYTDYKNKDYTRLDYLVNGMYN